MIKLQPVQFGGIYIQKVEGRTNDDLYFPVNTNVELMVNNDAQGNHLDQFRSIVAPGIHDKQVEPDNIIVFNETDGNGYRPNSFWVTAGYQKQLSLKDPVTHDLVDALLKEVKALHPMIKLTLTNALAQAKE